MDRQLGPVWSGISHNLQKLPISCRSKIKKGSVILIDDPYCIHQRMLDVCLRNAVLEGAPVDFPHFFDPKTHATSRTSKLGMAMAPAPPIRARMRVT